MKQYKHIPLKGLSCTGELGIGTQDAGSLLALRMGDLILC